MRTRPVLNCKDTAALLALHCAPVGHGLQRDAQLLCHWCLIKGQVALADMMATESSRGYLGDYQVAK
jgi:hypothetical protein